MKYLYTTLILSLLAISAHAQISDDTTRINLSGTTIMIINDDLQCDSLDHEDDSKDMPDDLTNWAGFFLGVNGFYTEPKKSIGLPQSSELFELDYARSLNASLNIFERRFELGTKHIGLTTGLGFEFNRYEFKRNVRIMQNSDSTWAIEDSLPQYDKNFLKATYLQIPLMLDFTTAAMEKGSISLAAGLIGGVRIGSKTKLKYFEDGDKNKDRVSSDYNLNPIKLSATARLSLGNLTLYANYGLTALFDGDKGPELYPFSVGLSVIPF